MNFAEINRTMKEAGYDYNPYTGWWSRRSGERTADIHVLPGGGRLAVYDGSVMKGNQVYASLADAVEAGRKWTEDDNG